MTGLLVGLKGDNSEKYSNPFQLSDKVKRELILRAEIAGGRALSWDFSHFDKIGGKGTLQAVWKRLKSESLIRGEKRSLSTDSDEEGEAKKAKISLNNSGTCELINNIELDYAENESLAASVQDENFEREVIEPQLDEFLHQYDQDVLNSDVESVEYENDMAFLMISDVESIPDLAEPDSLSQYETDSDSGMIEETSGNVTNLCRERRDPVVRQGVITETGPFIPISLGFSMVDSDSDWEEQVDNYGYSTGVERRSLRLNIYDGRTESVDEEWLEILRLNGLQDGTNSRRQAVELHEDEAVDDNLLLQAVPYMDLVRESNEEEYNASDEYEYESDEGDYSIPGARCRTGATLSVNKSDNCDEWCRTGATLMDSSRLALSDRRRTSATLSNSAVNSIGDQTGRTGATLMSYVGGV